MAILFKEQIENRVERENNAKIKKHNALILRANQLREKLEELHQDCQDIMDTVEFVKSKGYRVPSHLERDMVYGGHNNLKFSSQQIGWGIDYLEYLDYQHLTFVNGKFYINCVDRFNGYKQWKELLHIDFNYECEYYIESCCRVMSSFINQFPEFKENFIKWISK